MADMTTTPAMTGKDRAMPNNSDQSALHDELRARLLEMADRIESAVQFPAVTAPLLHQWATDIRALTLPASEAVAWRWLWEEGSPRSEWFDGTPSEAAKRNGANKGATIEYAYTRPSPMPVDALRDAVPSNWCDPLLTGLDGLGPQPWGCPQVERLLNGIRERITALLSGGAAREE